MPWKTCSKNWWHQNTSNLCMQHPWCRRTGHWRKEDKLSYPKVNYCISYVHSCVMHWFCKGVLGSKKQLKCYQHSNSFLWYIKLANKVCLKRVSVEQTEGRNEQGEVLARILHSFRMYVDAFYSIYIYLSICFVLFKQR